MNSEKVKEIKEALEERTRHEPINCSHSECVEACGRYCRHRREFVADMGSKNGQTCENCNEFNAIDEVKEYADILTLINELENENERLKTQLAQANAGIVNCSGCKLVELNAVRAFAEKLKEKLQNFIYDNEDYDGKLDSGILCVDLIGVIGMNGEIISLGLIDRLLKEYEK